MSLKTFVKVSGINNLSDARYCAGMGVDVLGFNIDALTQDYISPEKFVAIQGWLSGVSFAAEFSLSSARDIEMQLKGYPNVEFLQIENPDDISGLTHLDIPLILSVDVSKFDSAKSISSLMEEYEGVVRYFLFELGMADISSIPFEQMLPLAERYPVILGYGINADNVGLLIEQTSMAGIALKGGDEIRPGYKHFDELADILELIEVEE
jgi:phosphoribosylanthranilate isomerase